ncbi:MAG TPA: glycosyltransferase family 4 protein [bacterium]|nr:glycosyltransferase family 4 protein [bacterium]
MPASGKSLHVALLSYRGNMFCGGQGVYLTNIARALVARGHRVRVMAGPPYPDPVAGAEMDLIPGENFINRPAAALPARPLSVFAPLNFLEYGLARAGINPEMLAFSLRSFARLRALHARDPVDVVHDNQGLGYGLLLMKALGVPVAATIHHPLRIDRAEDIRQMHGLTARIRRSLYYPVVMQKLVARRLDRVMTVSAFSRDLVWAAYGLDRGRMSVVPNGVDAGLFRPVAGVKREPGRLLFVGSTEDRKKGIIYLLRALAELPDRFKLVIVDGRRYPGRVYARDAVAALGLGPRVEFRDRITNDELVIEYNRAALAVVPSLFEGFGLPALEAMACAVPLICTTAGALPEVADPSSALLIRPRSSGAIREAVLRLDADPAARERMGQAARQRALESFSWDRAAEMVEEQYRMAIADGRRSRPARQAHSYLAALRL